MVRPSYNITKGVPFLLCHSTALGIPKKGYKTGTVRKKEGKMVRFYVNEFVVIFILLLKIKLSQGGKI